MNGSSFVDRDREVGESSQTCSWVLTKSMTTSSKRQSRGSTFVANFFADVLGIVAIAWPVFWAASESDFYASYFLGPVAALVYGISARRGGLVLWSMATCVLAAVVGNVATMGPLPMM